MNEALLIKDKAKEILNYFCDEKIDPIVTERENAFQIRVRVESAGSLIGKNGETLDAFQQLIRACLVKEIGYKKNIVLDVNNYREKQVSSLEKDIREAAFKVRESGKSVELRPMNSYERRVAHTLIAQIADVDSESVGEGRERRIVIKAS